MPPGMMPQLISKAVLGEEDVSAQPVEFGHRALHAVSCHITQSHISTSGYRMPLFSLFGKGIVAPAMGIARGALSLVVERLGTQRMQSGSRLAEEPTAVRGDRRGLCRHPPGQHHGDLGAGAARDEGRDRGYRADRERRLSRRTGARF